MTNKGTVVLDHHDGWEGWDTVPGNIIETRSQAPQLEGEAAEEAVANEFRSVRHRLCGEKIIIAEYDSI